MDKRERDDRPHNAGPELLHLGHVARNPLEITWSGPGIECALAGPKIPGFHMARPAFTL
ncbi:hypothetical protein ASZ90_011180 [hydrocarbon metagenome]|uniref:Uncharacterized protein n=1 Tax=hydrocarbon metagenome TaxID=938273 RepID=A0A0W8FE28_9ZZZZ